MENGRKSGIDPINGCLWGTHFCYIYLDLDDLINALVPYFKEGLSNNEMCAWVIPKSYSPEEIRSILSKRIDNFDQHINKEQIDILSYDQVYVIDNVFDKQKTLDVWLNKLDRSLARGFDGLRVAGSTDWVEIKDWKQFTEYEKEVDSIIVGRNMIALCNYSILDCSPVQLANAVLTHQYCIIDKEGEKKVVGNNDGSAITALRNKNQELESFNKLCVDRELRIIELKKEVESLRKKLKDSH